jgi:hypothetical protein
VIGRPPFDRHELLKLNLNLRFGSAFAVASDVPALIEGVHADSLLYILDEAKEIPAGTFDAVKGAFAGEGEAMGLASSTPGQPTGRFFDIQTQKPGHEDWRVVHVSLDRALAAGRVSAAWAEQRALQWGRNSALYANRVLGEFHSADEEGVIPLSWIEAKFSAMASDRTPAQFPSFANVEDERRHRKQRLAAAFRLFGHFGFDEGVAGPHHRTRPRAPRPLLGQPARDELQAYPREGPDPRQ